MKKIILSLSISFCLVFFICTIQVGCKKSETSNNTQTTTIQGLWIGSITVTGQSTTSYYSFIIKPDGTIIADSKEATTAQQHLSIGTWTLVDDTLRCTNQCVYGAPSNIGIVQDNKAYFNSASATLTGTWSNVAPLTGTGAFTMTKIQ